MPSAVHPVDQRVQPVAARRPGRRRQSPSPAWSSRRDAEPAVVQHVALDADLRRRRSASVDQPVQVVVEVDRLPDVQRRPGASATGCWRAGAQVAVEAPGHLVQAVAVRAVEPRARCTTRPSPSRTSPGSSSSPPPSTLLAGEQPLGVVRVVAAPAGVHGPDLAAAEAEAGRAGVQQRAAVRAGAAPAVLPQVGAASNGAAAARAPLPARPAKSSSSVAPGGTGRASTRSSSWYGVGAALVTVARVRSRPLGNSSRTSRSRSRPASSTASTSTRPAPAPVNPRPPCRPASPTSTANAGDQPIPGERPAQAGPPFHPVRCSGRTATRGCGSRLFAPGHHDGGVDDGRRLLGVEAGQFRSPVGDHRQSRAAGFDQHRHAVRGHAIAVSAARSEAVMPRPSTRRGVTPTTYESRPVAA